MVDFAAFLAAFVSNPTLVVIVVLVVGMLVVNRATNATNAIGAAIGTRSIGPRAAIIMGAVCNFAGLVVMTLVSPAVADTIGHLVNFNGEAGAALPALAATMPAIVVWSLVAWRSGIPVSHTHALVAGLDGVYGDYPLWVLVFSALCLAAGSCIGGKKIIKTTAMDMADLEKHQGFAASLAAGVCLLAASFSGVPVSTTHTKTAAMMGAGAARRLKSVKWGIAGNVVAVWVLTFPYCAVLGGLFAKLFLCIL